LRKHLTLAVSGPKQLGLRKELIDRLLNANLDGMTLPMPGHIIEKSFGTALDIIAVSRHQHLLHFPTGPSGQAAETQNRACRHA
jgi:hypothetical protein